MMPVGHVYSLPITGYLDYTIPPSEGGASTHHNKGDQINIKRKQ